MGDRANGGTHSRSEKTTAMFQTCPAAVRPGRFRLSISQPRHQVDSMRRCGEAISVVGDRLRGDELELNFLESRGRAAVGTGSVESCEVCSDRPDSSTATRRLLHSQMRHGTRSGGSNGTGIKSDNRWSTVVPGTRCAGGSSSFACTITIKSEATLQEAVRWQAAQAAR